MSAFIHYFYFIFIFSASRNCKPSTTQGSDSTVDVVHYDVGHIVNKTSDRSKLSQQDILNYLDKHFVPTENFKFHEQKIFKATENRHVTLTFQTSWLRQYPWLVYSPTVQGGLWWFYWTSRILCISDIPQGKR